MASGFYIHHDPESQVLRYGTVERWLMAKGFSRYQVEHWRDTIFVPIANGDAPERKHKWYSRDQIREAVFGQNKTG